MKCEDALLLLSGHIDQVNTQHEEQLLQEHLAACSQCRQVLRAYEQADEELVQLKEKAPADLCGKVMKQIDRQTKKKQYRPWLGIAVAAALVLVIGISAVMQKGDLPFAQEPMAASETQGFAVARSMPSDGSEDLAQKLADEYGAAVVLIREEYEQIKTYPSRIEDGNVLYLLPDYDAAVLLTEHYGCVLYEPSDQTATSEAYALLVS